MDQILNKIRLPIGSLVVDVGLVVYVVFMTGQLVERLEGLDERMRKIESMPVTPEAAGRMATIDAKYYAHEREVDQLRGVVVDRLRSIEEKLDQHIAVTANGKDH